MYEVLVYRTTTRIDETTIEVEAENKDAATHLALGVAAESEDEDKPQLDWSDISGDDVEYTVEDVEEVVIKYTCHGCGRNAWGSSGLHILCERCTDDTGAHLPYREPGAAPVPEIPVVEPVGVPVAIADATPAPEPASVERKRLWHRVLDGWYGRYPMNGYVIRQTDGEYKIWYGSNMICGASSLRKAKTLAKAHAISKP